MKVLIKKKKKFSNAVHMKGKELQEMRVRPDRHSNPSFRKQPCGICESLNFPGRFHLTVLCRYINKNAQKNFKQVNSFDILASENEKSIRLNENDKS